MDAPRHLIHVGFPKAGATFFKAWAAARDDVAFAPGGVGGFRRVEQVPDGVAGRMPRLLVTSHEGLAVGKSGGPNMTWLTALAARRAVDLIEEGRAGQDAVCTTLRELFAGAHVLVLVRGYASMLASIATQTVKAGESWRSFRGGFDEGELAWYAATFDYDRVVSLYERAFGAGRVTVLPYELLRDDREAFVAALCRAGAVPYRPFDPGRVNASPPPHALGLIDRLSGPVHAGVRRLPERWAPRALGAYGRALARVRDRPWFDALGRAAGAAPFPSSVAAEGRLRAVFGGRADAVARRPEVAPYAAEYLAGGDDDGPGAPTDGTAVGP